MLRNSFNGDDTNIESVALTKGIRLKNTTIKNADNDYKCKVFIFIF